ncbi:carbohydrate kinase [Maribellus comscasis]|uniref:Carbohydrate kinase n=1 Tax=Maribellus comscasis TaxID=2681766 RepID=A0A6I6JVG0_9BACT|nr:carbohydrate kinase [Maribellus comscasis]QGY43283.1 carbohydrate kinase [Maribellus comscasis]
MQKNQTENIVCFGEVLWDMLLSGAKPGGAPMNVAIHLKKQGQNPAIISKTGDDEEGKALIRFLEKSGLNSNYIAIDKELPTSKVLVHLDENKNATYEICKPVAWDNINSNVETEKLVSNAEIVIFGSLASRTEVTKNTLIQLLKNSDAKRLFDVNLRPPFDDREIVETFLKLSDFVKLNDEELVKIASWHNKSGKLTKLTQWVSEFYECPDICVTRGANGALLFINNTIFEHPGFKVTAADTVGAGDSFLASLVANLEKNYSPEKSLEYACATGAFVASQPGAVPDYSEKDIEKLIQTTM